MLGGFLVLEFVSFYGFKLVMTYTLLLSDLFVFEFNTFSFGQIGNWFTLIC